MPVMPRSIRILPPELQNQIAAGEVVERPSSVLKELLENSLDADAGRIQVLVDRGGQGLIQVQDDGVGILPHELELAVTRHATSKIASQEDLFNLRSFGFRGEALPSLASVSRLKLTSATSGDGEAFFIAVDAGRIMDQGPAALTRGTKVEVRDLFVNIPARLKFLKTPTTEGKRCQDVFCRLALTRLSVHFEYVVGSRTALSMPATNDLRQRLELIWPDSVTENLLPVLSSQDDMSLQGLISAPHNVQGQADRLFLYVNDRPVQDKLLLRAVRDAYQGRLLTKEYPQAALFLSMPPEEVDVNVHPAKAEVRFRNQQRVFSFVRQGVLQALERLEKHRLFRTPFADSADSAQARLFPSADFGKNLASSYSQDVRTKYKFAALREDQREFEQTPPAPPYPGLGASSSPQSARPQAGPAVPSTASESPLTRAGMLYLGQTMDSYLVLASSDGLILVDQHAAHERVLFQRLKSSVRPLPRDLLPTLEIPLHPTQQDRLQDIWAQLSKLGFRLATLRPGLLEVQGIPEHLEPHQAREFLMDVLDDQAEDLETMWTMMACKAALKAGQTLAISEALHLLEAWLECPDTSFCPHGRPIMLRLDRGDLERMFKRRG